MKRKKSLVVPFIVTLLVCTALTASAQTYSGAKLAADPGQSYTGNSTTRGLIPPGYLLQSDGSYYNSGTEMYYDPSSGNYTSFDTVTQNAASPAVSQTPGLPNTGAGGNSLEILGILGALIVIAITGIAYTARRT